MTRIHLLGDDMDTDQLIPARYCASVDPEYLAKFLLHDTDPQFRHRVRTGDVILAGRNFGCGSSREAAALALKGTGASCLVAASVSRIFYRNAVNIGLRVLTCDQVPVEIRDGTECSWIADGKTLVVGAGVVEIKGFPRGIESEILEAGGLVPYLVARNGILAGGHSNG